MLGTDLVAHAPAGVAVTGLAKSEADITQARCVAEALDRVLPDVVINAAAYSKVDAAESEFDAARAVNGDAPGVIGGECAKRGVRVVHFGTDYVFSGSSRSPIDEDAPTSPVNAYGRSKLLGEERLRASGVEALVIRTQWLFGGHGRSFPRTMWERAKARLATRVVNDQFGRPTYTVDLARATWRLVALGASGAYHVTNGGDAATWYDVATEVFARAGVAELVSACSTADYPTAARRPAYTVLDTARAEAALGGALPDWREGLSEFLSQVASDW
jgi:dTDP-4-dehydrorhamnose reductase